MIDEAIQFYHDILSGQNLASDTAEALFAFQKQRGIAIQGRPLCSILRPHFITQSQYRLLSTQCRYLFSALKKTRDRLLIDPELRPLLNLSETDEELLSIPSGYDSDCPIGRWDTFFDGDGQFRITEFNSDSPAGAGYCDELATCFLSLSILKNFRSKYAVNYHDCLPRIVEGILSCYARWQKDHNESPRLAIVDWDNVRTASEFPLVSESFKRMGIPVQIADPRQLDYRNHKLYAGGQQVNCVYKRVLVKELLEIGVETPLINAAKEGAVCIVNSLNSRLFGKKLLLAIMSDPQQHTWFSPEEIAAIQSHVPWTRLLTEGHTTYHGQVVDLVPHVISQQSHMVLKPDHNYGGRGVIIGNEVTQSEWEQAVSIALGQTNIIQERLHPAKVPFPSIQGDQLVFSNRVADTAPFIMDGQLMSGCLSRASESAIVNVTAGTAATLPTMIIADK